MHILALLLLCTSVFASEPEPEYIIFPDGNKVENPFHPTFFEEDSKQEIPAGFADPNMNLSQLAEDADPGGLGTSCDLYEGELHLVKTIKERFELSNDQALRCLDLMNTAGIVVAAQFVLKDTPVKASQFLEDVDKLDISHSDKMKYQRVIRDTVRAIRSGKLSTNPYTGNFNEESARADHFASILYDCAHSYQYKIGLK